ncbi:MAG: hypothetical protein WA942_14060, partial [Mycolicibacter sinensis]
MSRLRTSQGGQQANAGQQRRNRAIGASSAVAAFLAFGMAPLATAPPAQADLEDLFDFSWFNELFAPADTTAALELAPGAADGLGFDMTSLIDQWFYTPMHMGIQAWITSDFGEMINNSINQMAGLYLIGNGIDGTALNPDGGAAGLWLGDGGAGWD